MSLIQPQAPQWQPDQGSSYESVQWVQPVQGAVWRPGDVIIPKTVGSNTQPNPNGSLAALPGPLLSLVTTGISASAGAPQQDYYGIVSYIGAASIESLTSQPFVINCPAGYLPTVSVSATGAPGAATSFATYLATVPTFYVQQANNTALGATFTAANPLTNAVGYANAATNVSGSIVGIAKEDSSRFFAGFPGGSQQTGARSLFGASPDYQALDFKVPITKCQNGVFIMPLLQPYYSGLNNTTAGLSIDTGATFTPNGTNFWLVDTAQSNKVVTILRRASSGSVVEQDGDVGALVFVRFIPSTLA
jgi:hypothetical protein